MGFRCLGAWCCRLTGSIVRAQNSAKAWVGFKRSPVRCVACVVATPKLEWLNPNHLPTCLLQLLGSQVFVVRACRAVLRHDFAWPAAASFGQCRKTSCLSAKSLQAGTIVLSFS